MQGTVEELYWIGVLIILLVGVVGAVEVVLKYMVGER